MILQFGKHKGEDIQDVDADYLRRLISLNHTAIGNYKEELSRRNNGKTESSFQGSPKRFTFGKHKGRLYQDVDAEYLEWLIENNAQTIEYCQDELYRRDILEEAKLPWVERIVRSGYKSLSSQVHPDHGGNTSDMQELNAAKERLLEMIKRSNLR